MWKRTAIAAAMLSLACMALASPALAAEKTSEKPIEHTATEVKGTDATPMFEGIKIENDKVVVTVDQYGEARPITIDYGDLKKDRTAQGAGALGIAFVGMSLVGRFARLVRSIFGPFGG